MTDTEFLNLIESTFSRIEEALDQSSIDIDCEHADGMLKLLFPNKRYVVLNKQTPLHQLWLAGKSQGYHFDYIDNDWICNRTGKNLLTVFNEACSDTAGMPLTFGF